MQDAEFASYIESALTAIPEEIRNEMGNVSVVFSDWPTREQLVKAKISRGLLLGLYEGIPKTKGGGYRNRFPDKITIFKIPILMLSKSKEDAIARIKDTVIHEVAHHFGMDEDEVRDAEHARKSN